MEISVNCYSGYIGWLLISGRSDITNICWWSNGWAESVNKIVKCVTGFSLKTSNLRNICATNINSKLTGLRNLPTTTSRAVSLITGGTLLVKYTWQSKSPLSCVWTFDILRVAASDTWYRALRNEGCLSDGLVATQLLLWNQSTWLTVFPLLLKFHDKVADWPFNWYTGLFGLLVKLWLSGNIQRKKKRSINDSKRLKAYQEKFPTCFTQRCQLGTQISKHSKKRNFNLVFIFYF